MIHWERDLDNNEALRKVSSTHDLLNVMKGHAMVMVIRIINITEIKFEGKVSYCVTAHNESHQSHQSHQSHTQITASLLIMAH